MKKVNLNTLGQGKPVGSNISGKRTVDPISVKPRRPVPKQIDIGPPQRRQGSR